MPHLSSSCGPHGPVIQFVVSVSAPRKIALQQAGLPIPDPVPIMGLIDTGASVTCIDPTILGPLNLEVRGYVPMVTPSTGTAPVRAAQYDVDIYLISAPGPNSVRFFSSVPIVESVLVNQGIHALVGRDILSQCLLIFDGRASTFTLAI